MIKRKDELFEKVFFNKNFFLIFWQEGKLFEAFK